MYVVSTIRYSDFPSNDSSLNKGALLLKRFIKFAEEQSFSSVSVADSGEKSICYYIKNDLEEKGYIVDSNVGNSDYKVDLAIKNQNGDSYCLGILIDTSEIAKNISTRDKLYVFESVLNNLKWKIINIYSVEYFKNPVKTINKIIEAIDMSYVKETIEINPNIVKNEGKGFKYNSYPYEFASNLNYTRYDNESGFDYGLKELLARIIVGESPISLETIKNRVREHSNIQSMSSKAKSRIEMALKSIARIEDQNQKFYWKNSNFEIERFRIGGKRDLYDICKEEILCVMKQILEVQGDISKDDLFRLTLEAIACTTSVLNTKALDRLNYVYNWALANKKIITKY